MQLVFLGIVFLVIVILLALKRPLYQAILGALIAAALLATGAAAQNPSAYFMEGSTFRSQFNPAFAPLRLSLIHI